MKIGIGIDTGGTCTDSVALDLTDGKVLAKGKTETTREDLSIGISKALDALPQEYIKNACIVSLSTTLATNACIEGKGCRAKLVLFGLPEEYIIRMHAPENYNLKPENVLCIDTHGSADGLIIDEPDWEELFEKHGDWLRDSDALCAVELYSDDNGAPCEKKFKKLAEEKLGIKCVSANELTSGINVFARGATALLNARLFPVVEEFVDAARADFRKRGCKAPVMIVRSDASLMSDKITLSRPVETILSGPAASVLAGKHFSNSENCIIVDMGGTSTDISVLKGGKPVKDKNGIKISTWATSVRGIKVSPFNLGGDTAIRLDKGELKLFPRRVRSVCSAAVEWPQIKDDIKSLLTRRRHNIFPLHEFFYMVKEPESLNHFNDQEKKLLKALKNGPVMLADLQTKADIDIYGLDSERLESEGIIMRCGLTPTDFMHIKKDYVYYDREASLLAAFYILQAFEKPGTEADATDLADEAYELVRKKMYENIMQIMLQRQYPKVFAEGTDEQVMHIISQAWDNRNNSKSSLIRQTFSTDYTLIGIGAPTHIFLPDVAKALGAPYILPENAEVANAIGALKADLNAQVRINVTERFDQKTGAFMYIVHLPDGSIRLENKEEAIRLAKETASKTAIEEARLRGGEGDISVKLSEEYLNTKSKAGKLVKLACCIVAEAEVRYC